MPYEVEEIVAIVLDIDKYPEFLPWCSSAKILSSTADEQTAQLEITFKGYVENYVSRVLLTKDHNQYIVTSEAISGHFKYLKSTWVVQKKNNLSQVEFFIDFQFKSKILNSIVGLMLSTAINKIITAFEDRVRALSV
ncbi:MAG: type II toxin-antitoxin system RatA family toxin [Rickettsiaceae bacterium]